MVNWYSASTRLTQPQATIAPQPTGGSTDLLGTAQTVATTTTGTGVPTQRTIVDTNVTAPGYSTTSALSTQAPATYATQAPKGTSAPTGTSAPKGTPIPPKSTTKPNVTKRPTETVPSPNPSNGVAASKEEPWYKKAFDIGKTILSIVGSRSVGLLLNVFTPLEAGRGSDFTIRDKDGNVIGDTRYDTRNIKLPEGLR